MEACPWLLKPNREELSILVGRELSGEHEITQGAREILDKGVGALAVTLGENGAILATERAMWHATAPTVKPVNTVGCGDAFLAGIIHAKLSGLPPNDMLRWGVACGTANVLLEVPGGIRYSDAMDLMGKVEIEKL